MALQFKRSTTSVSPASLEFGEIALGSEGDLFIGLSDGSIRAFGGIDFAKKSYADSVSATALASAKTYTDDAVAALVGSAPETLNTLAELAAALGDDENFATTVSTNIGNNAAAIAAEKEARIQDIASANSRIDDAETRITALENGETGGGGDDYGTMAYQNSNSVEITGGTISGVGIDFGTF